jgi:sec-independent protein translocase protein TatA
MDTSMLAFIGGTEIMWIAIVVLVLFGAKKVPELMKGVGTGIREFKKASKDVQDEVQRVMDEPERPSPPPSSSTSPVRPSSDTISHSPKA